jgi:hypothetical protein
MAAPANALVSPASGSPSERTLCTIAVLVFVALFVQFYWTTLRSGFQIMSGDEADAMLVAFLQEHVYQSLLGHASLRNPPFFFPVQGVLGHSDTFLLNQVFYAPLRLLGVERLLAAQLTWMSLSVMGGVALMVLLSRFFQVRPWVAIMVAGVFAFGHPLYMKMGHSQHLAIHFLPVVALLAFSAIFRERPALRTAALAGAAGLMYGLTFATGYYMAWFFAFFLMFAVPVFAICYWTTILEFARAHRARLVVASIAAAVGFGIGAAVLLSIYASAIGALSGLSANQYLATAATFRDILNVSDGNLLWGKLLRNIHLIPLERLQLTESHLAVTPLLVLTAITGTVVAFRDHVQSDYRRLAIALCAAVLFGYVMLYVCTISFRGTTSLFLTIQKFVPGAVAIRTGFRSQVISAMFIALAAAVAAEAYLRAGEREQSPNRTENTRLRLIVCLGILVALEQVDRKQLSFVDRTKEMAVTDSAPLPPPDCRMFAITNDGSRMLQAIHIDAMRLTQRFGIPTLNGYSGGNPPGWDFGNVWEPNYVEKLRTWSRNKGLMGPMCLYDAAGKTWRDLGAGPY